MGCKIILYGFFADIQTILKCNPIFCFHCIKMGFDACTFHGHTHARTQRMIYHCKPRVLLCLTRGILKIYRFSKDSK